MEIRLYDTPEYFDRYTLVIDRGDGNHEFYAMSENPENPQGMNLFCGTKQDGYKEGPHLGEKPNEIPESIQSAMERRI